MRLGVLVLLLAAPAFAQDVPQTSPDAPAVSPEPLGARLVWERRGRVGNKSPVAGVDVQLPVAGAWIAVDEAGAVWLSESEGSSWDRVLAPLRGLADELPDDEAVLLEAESRRDEALDDVDTTISEIQVDPSLPENVEVQVEVDAADLEDASLRAAELAEERAQVRDTLPVVWVDPTQFERVLVARADGIWASTDSGRTWEHTHVHESGDPQVTAFYRAADGSLILGTTDGVRFSFDDGATWLDAQDATDGARIRSIVTEAGRIWAAADQGLFRSEDGLHWDPIVLPARVGVHAVVADPAWENGFWIATEGAMYRTDDAGASFYVAGRQPLRGLVDMVHLDEAGHLLAISSDGVWESMDGGVSWLTADRRLSDPDVRTLSFADSGPVIATATGVWILTEPRDGVGREIVEKVPDLSVLVEAATHRAGLDIDLLSLSRTGVLARFAPQLELDFAWSRGASRDAYFTSARTIDQFDDDWSLAAQVCWGNCSSTIISTDVDEISFGDANFYVDDGSVFDESEPVAAAANAAQKIRSYRRYLAEHLADAWIARRQLASERSTIRTLSLSEQVKHALQLEELDARLDALTDGAFSRGITRTPRFEESP